MSEMSCTLCGGPIPDPSQPLYTKAGDVACAACLEKADREHEQERQAESRIFRIAAASAVLSAFATCVLWVLAYKDKTYVYVNTGADASFAIIKAGLGVALFVLLVVFIGVYLVLNSRRRSKAK